MRGIYGRIKVITEDNFKEHLIMIKEIIKIGNVELKNRLIMPPVATYLSTDDGKVTDKIIEYYGARSKGGNIGMIITEHCYIFQQGKAKANQLSIANDDDVEGLTRLVNIIHQNGTKAMAQLNHAGATTFETLTGMRKVSASAVPFPFQVSPLNEVLPEALTPGGISELVDCFALAAVRAKFDSAFRELIYLRLQIPRIPSGSQAARPLRRTKA